MITTRERLELIRSTSQSLLDDLGDSPPPPDPAPAGAVRTVSTSQFPGATLGERLAAAEAFFKGKAGEIIVEVDGIEAVNQQITFAKGRVLRLVGAGTVTSTNEGKGNPYLVLSGNSALICDTRAVVLQVPSGKDNYEIFRTLSANTNNNDRTVGIRIEGCTFQGLGRTGDGAQSLVDLGNCIDFKIIRNKFINADVIGICVGGASGGMASKAIVEIAPTNDAVASLIKTSTAHGFLVGDRVRLSGITQPFELNSHQRLTVASDGSTTIKAKTANFKNTTHKGQRVQLFASNVNQMTVVLEVLDKNTLRVADAVPAAAEVTADFVFTSGGAWVVHSVPSPTTFTVEYCPVSSEKCSSGGCGTATLYNEARNGEIEGNHFEFGSLTDLAPVNAKNVTIRGNFFGPRGMSASGGAIDLEPNTFADVVEGILIDGNTFDNRGSQSNTSTAFSAIAIGGGFGMPEQIIVRGNIVRGATIGSSSYTESPTGGIAAGMFQFQDCVYIWQGRDIQIIFNSFLGFYNIGVEVAGQSITERLIISNNKFGPSQGGVVWLRNTRFSEITENSYEWRNWHTPKTNYHVGQSASFIRESDGSGFNLYRNNTGIASYVIDSTSKREP